MRSFLCDAATVAALLIGGGQPALALTQSEPTPSEALAALRADVQGRADHNAYPVQGIHPEDAREVLASLHSTDRDEWAAAWSAMGQRYADRARAAEAGNDKATARED